MVPAEAEAVYLAGCVRVIDVVAVHPPASVTVYEKVPAYWINVPVPV
jgi:hypothetical protein